MKVLSIINLKGGVAKTISSVNMAHILVAVKGFKVLLIDNDKQGNASKIMNRHSYDHKGTAEVMTQRGIDPAEVIQHTDFDGLDIITANMNLLTANLEVMLDQSRPQQTRFKKFLGGLQNEYDYVFCHNQCANTKCAKHITKAYECGGACSMQLLRGQPECAGYISRRKRK